jgi:hypothetical protein
MKKLESITRLMNSKEVEIARMTARINQIGEENVGKQYLFDYNESLRVWDELKVERDQIKSSI